MKNGSAATGLPIFHKNKIEPVSNPNEKKASWLKRNWSTLLLMFILLIGVGLLSYPTVADWWNTYWSAKAVGSYMETITNMTEEEYNYYYFRAEAYNRRLAEKGAMWNMTPVEEVNYENVLNFDPSGMMGYIDIKKIDIKLPIYHGVSEEVLSGAVGHIPASSLPVGGESSHCVISGHRGLPSARLFTDLDKLVEGDTFALIIMDRTLTYQIDQIRIVEPTNLSDLQIVPGKDYCTLVTCTPYGVNTHRLLIRGFRTENPNGNALVVADAMQIEPALIAPMIAVPILILLVVLMFIVTGHKKRKKKKRIAMNGGIDPLAEIDPEDLLINEEEEQ